MMIKGKRSAGTSTVATVSTRVDADLLILKNCVRNTLKLKNVQEQAAQIDILKGVNGLKQEVTAKGILNANIYMLLLFLKMKDRTSVKAVQTYGMTKGVWCSRISMENNYFCV